MVIFNDTIVGITLCTAVHKAEQPLQKKIVSDALKALGANVLAAVGALKGRVCADGFSSAMAEKA